MIRSGQCGICGSAYKTIISTIMRAWDLRLAMGYSSDILENVQAFLASQNAGRQNPERDLSEIKQAAFMLGYGEPFDQEQRAINELLRRLGACDQICLAVWAYYHDMKMNRAVVRDTRA